MIHSPLCPCGDDPGPGDTRAHEWIIGDVIALRYDGVGIARLDTILFGKYGRWKYMGERRRWRKTLRYALPSEWPVADSEPCCPGCAGTRWRGVKNRKGIPIKRLCKSCGQQRHVVVYRVRGPRQRQWDHANLVAACRPLIDSLVEHGFLVDDAPAWMTARYDDTRKWARQATIVLIYKERPHDVRG